MAKKWHRSIAASAMLIRTLLVCILCLFCSTNQLALEAFTLSSSVPIRRNFPYQDQYNHGHNAMMPYDMSTRMRPHQTSTSNQITLESQDQQEKCCKDEDCGYSDLRHLSRNQLFDKTNVIKYSMPVPPNTTLFLDKISPKQPSWLERIMDNLDDARGKYDNSRSIGVDVTVEFDDAKLGATELIQRCLSSSSSNQNTRGLETTENYITSILSLFQKHISESDDGQNVRCKARIVSSLGSVGTKCPRWHLDYVPLRLVQSLIGPGCVYIPFENERLYPEGLNRDALNDGLDEDDSVIANSMIIPGEASNKNLVKHAKDGEAVLLMGRAWSGATSTTAISSASDPWTNGVPAVPHRSPGINEDQLRVLLVVDIVRPSEGM